MNGMCFYDVIITNESSIVLWWDEVQYDVALQWRDPPSEVIWYYLFGATTWGLSYVATNDTATEILREPRKEDAYTFQSVSIILFRAEGIVIIDLLLHIGQSCPRTISHCSLKTYNSGRLWPEIEYRRNNCIEEGNIALQFIGEGPPTDSATNSVDRGLRCLLFKFNDLHAMNSQNKITRLLIAGRDAKLTIECTRLKPGILFCKMGFTTTAHSDVPNQELLLYRTMHWISRHFLKLKSPLRQSQGRMEYWLLKFLMQKSRFCLDQCISRRPPIPMYRTWNYFCTEAHVDSSRFLYTVMACTIPRHYCPNRTVYALSVYGLFQYHYYRSFRMCSEISLILSIFDFECVWWCFTGKLLPQRGVPLRDNYVC